MLCFIAVFIWSVFWCVLGVGGDPLLNLSEYGRDYNGGVDRGKSIS